MRPAVLLDIDGVLSPLSIACPDGFEELQLDVYDVRLSRRHAAWLRELGRNAELVWATSWEHDANTLISPQLGLPDLDVITLHGQDARQPTWKLPDIIAWAGRHPTRPIAWVDDELGDDARRWAQSRTAPTLLIAVAPNDGLCRGHIDQLLRWLTRHTPDHRRQ